MTDRGAKARHLQLEVRHRLDGQLHGEHLGVHQGTGGDLAEARLYQPGDDVRRLDWAVLARTSVPHVRTTTPTRELETTVVVDLTPSMAFGTRVQTKRELALTAVSAFGHLASGPGDRLAGVLLTTAGVRRLPPRTARLAVPGLLSTLERVEVGEGTAPPLADALRAVPLPRRGLVVVVSDLLGERTWERPLRLLAQRHDVVVVQVWDPRELELPHVGMLRVVDPETGRRLDVPTGSKRLRERYAAAAAARHAAIAHAVRGAGAAHLPLATDGDWLRDLTRFLRVRRQVRGARRAGA